MQRFCKGNRVPLWKSAEAVKDVAHLCLSQSAATTANQFVIVTCNPKQWRRSQQRLIEEVEKQGAPKSVRKYYEKLIPITYTAGWLNALYPIKLAGVLAYGLFKPIVRGPFSRRDIEEVAIKSAALACENFVLALAAQGVSSCMMEGFDEWRVKRRFKLSGTTRVVMVIAVGYAAEGGIWGRQFRLPLEEVVHER